MTQRERWVARAELANGETIEKVFPYNANGNYLLEEEEQYKAECWLIEEHEDVVWYSVDYEEV